MAELVITLSDGRMIRRMLADSHLVIGRDSGCDLGIDDPAASRRHARFSKAATGFVVEDLGSKNGTLVNDAPCTCHALSDGDEILIGSTHIRFKGEHVHGTTSVIIDDGAEPATHATRYVSRDRELLLPQRRLQVIYDLSERLTKLQDRDELLRSTLKICFDMLQFERGAIGVRRPGVKQVDWPVVQNLRGAGGELHISRTLLNRALEHGERAIFTEDDAGMADPTISMVQQGIRSAMCVPLLNDDEVFGVIYGDRTSTSTSYSEEDSDFLAGIARQVSIGLINCRLVDEQKAMIRLGHEIDLARSIQTGLFPTALPSDAVLRVAALNEPGNRVSGDYYDVMPAPEGRTWCLMADVTGEGVAAALLMANLQAAVRLTMPDADHPAELLSKWNLLICRNTEASKFITCSLALLDPKKRTLKAASAGHCLPLIVRESGDPEELTLDAGLPLGVLEDAKFVAHEIELGDGPCAYFVYTDGVTEAMNVEQEQFGMQRLRLCLTESNDLNPQPMIKHIRRSVSQFAGGAPQSDDITMLVARMGA